MKKILMMGALALCSMVAQAAEGIVGYWTTIDDETKEAKSVVQIYEYQGKYYGRVVELLQNPGVQYHALGHTLRIMRFVRSECPEFDIECGLEEILDDNILMEYVRGVDIWDEVKENIKVEEQKWIKKAKKYLLYDDSLWRIKQIFVK